MKTVLITGITGQDGSYLAEFLLEKDYEVHGVVRRSSSCNLQRISHLRESLHLHEGDLTDSGNMESIIQSVLPDEIYNLAAMSHVGTSFKIPIYTADVDALGTMHLLEAMRKICPKSKFYQASTSELFGKVQETPQTERTPFYPRSPYGVAKLYAYWAVVNYREAWDLFACNGILFNHESPRRGENFVSRKITLAVARIMHNQQERLQLGNLDAKRDWGYAKDFVEGMWCMLQQDIAEDFVLATGEMTSVRNFVELAFQEVGITLEWVGQGIEEKGIDCQTGRVLVEINPQFFRPSEVELLIGDATKAVQKMGWKPRTCLRDLVSLMVDSDMKLIAQSTRKETEVCF
ncbi:MAG TPA: GDP-mannose 4,6-dehydratase [Candidatus Rhabdochlamydia sp.]|jgi:GDPmannose 4,6-dehydratase|nr:GDP-mannose 4,6-dehydratase [Candidatus Rhabdochlamydia sp.]